jgi:predicted acetyltransferase
MIKIKKFQDSTIVEGKKICLKHHLYVPTWSFQLWLTSDYFNIKQIFIIYNDDQPVGASIVLSDQVDVNVGFFIKVKYRCLGFGKKLIKNVIKNNKDYTLRYDYGILESRNFFKKYTKGVDNIKRSFYY